MQETAAQCSRRNHPILPCSTESPTERDIRKADVLLRHMQSDPGFCVTCAAELFDMMRATQECGELLQLYAKYLE